MDKKKPNQIKKWFSKTWEECKFAAQGVVLAMRQKGFWIAFSITFAIFGTLLNLLSSGFASFTLMGSVGLGGSLKIIWDAFLQLFGVNRTFEDWLSIFLLTILQSLIIGLLVLVWKKQKKNARSESLQNSGIIAGLLLLGGGCPTCGTALLTPILGAIFSTGGVAMAAKISGIITALAILLAFWTLKKIGYDAYVIIMTDKAEKSNSKS